MTATRALLLVDHGSRLPDANGGVEEVAAAVRARLGPGALVAHAHLELAAPDIPRAVADLAAAGVRELVVVPYFLGPGRHALEDVPARVAAAAADHPGLHARVTPPLGPHALLAEIALRRAGWS